MNGDRVARSKRLLAWLCGGVLIGAAAAAQATPVEFEFMGTVSDKSGNTGIFGTPSLVQVGQPFTGRFSYDVGPDNPDQQPADATLGVYNVIDFQIDQSVVPITPLAIVVTHKPGLPTLPPLDPDLGEDSFVVVGTYPAGDITRPVSLRLEATFGEVFNDDSLPSMLALADFSVTREVRALVVQGLMGSPDQLDAGQLSSLVVPEPSALSLMALGGWIVLRRQRLRRAAAEARRSAGRLHGSRSTEADKRLRARK